MAGDSATVEVDGHRIALTHLRKVLYPASGTTKSDIITYFAEVAHVMIPHLADRPVTRKRWPDGVTTAPFFHKDLPKGTPSWVPRRTIQHSDGPKNYPIVESPATLAWLGQIAALELHVPQWTFGAVTKSVAEPKGEITEAAFDEVRPNRLVFDLDPGPGVELADCARGGAGGPGPDGGQRAGPGHQRVQGHSPVLLAGRLADLRRGVRLRAGGRRGDRAGPAGPGGVPDGEVVATREGVHRLVAEQRIKTTIAPYSLRGREWPTVAAPRSWEELADPELRHLEYGEVLERLATAPDPMRGLETGRQRRRRAPRRPRPGKLGQADPAGHLPLHARRPTKTPEPVPEPGLLPHGDDDTFVIQEHHARRLHYDFRLERDGVLVSWAVPKGVPETPGSNQLAVHTEDHPLDYADFAGDDPARRVRRRHGDASGTAARYATEKWRTTR